MTAEPLRHLPYPELVEPDYDARDYEIHDSFQMRGAPSIGMVNKVDRLMWVPLSVDADFVRRHEMAHVKWSPLVMPRTKYEPFILMAVEDARINLALAARGLGCPEAPALREFAMRLVSRDIVKGHVAATVLRCIAAIGTDLAADFLDMTRLEAPDAQPLAQRLTAMVMARLERSRLRAANKEVASFRAALAAAAAVAKELQAAGLRFPSGGVLTIEGSLCASCRAGDADAERVHLLGLGGRQDREAATMHLVEAAMPIALASVGRRPRGWRSVREGAIVRTPGRWHTTRAIFRGRARGLGGTVLIDTSSSMRFCAADIDRIVKEAPWATLVAIYSGVHRMGELRIVAREGRRAAAADLAPYGPGNMIDLPALDWLAEQPGPRVWLSDARVTGVNDYASRYLARRCRQVCLKHGIRRAENAEEAAAILEGRALRRLPLMV